MHGRPEESGRSFFGGEWRGVLEIRLDRESDRGRNARSGDRAYSIGRALCEVRCLLQDVGSAHAKWAIKTEFRRIVDTLL